MTTNATMVGGEAFAAGHATTDEKPGFFSRLGTAYVNSLMKAGRARAARELLNLSDAHLHSIGLSDAQVATFRKTGRIPDDFWAN
ncbi:MAG: hypothetical protein AAGC70_16150 [Pseudomonadota bacterium]